MAKIRLGVMVGEASGSLGSTTFSRNRYGTYVRLRAKPVQPTTFFNDTAKSFMSVATKIWQDLTDDQRQAWRTYALTHPITDRLGDKQVLDGHAVCTQLNLNILYCQGTTIEIPPTTAAPASLETLALTTDIGAGNFEITYTPTPAGTNNTIWTWMAVVNSPGVQFIKNLYKLTDITPANQASPVDIQAQAVSRFGTLQVGQQVWVRVLVVDKVTGLKSGGQTRNGVIIST